MKVITSKRKSMIPQLEAAHIGAMSKLKRLFTSPESVEILDRVNTINVELSERMSTRAGVVHMKAAGNKYTSFLIKLNARLLANNFDQLVPTYLHELAHVVANLRANTNVGHGFEWKMVMRILGVSDERYHSMDTSAFERSPRKFKYVCVKCQREFMLTLIRHRKAQHYFATGSLAYCCPCSSSGSLEHKP